MLDIVHSITQCCWREAPFGEWNLWTQTQRRCCINIQPDGSTCFPLRISSPITTPRLLNRVVKPQHTDLVYLMCTPGKCEYINLLYWRHYTVGVNKTKQQNGRIESLKPFGNDVIWWSRGALAKGSYRKIISILSLSKASKCPFKLACNELYSQI